MEQQTAYYQPQNEWLLFEECAIMVPMNDLRRVPIPGSLVIRHYTRAAPLTNCYRHDVHYLNAIFKEWLLRNGPVGEELTGPVVRNRTTLLVQFQPQLEQARRAAALQQDEWPSYAVCFEMEPGGQETTVQISFRRVNRDSFLSTALDTYHRPVTDPLLRHCLLLEPNRAAQQQQPWRLRPALMPLAATTGRRILVVAKRGWLAVFLKNQPRCYLLLENEFLVLADDQMGDNPATLVYHRILGLGYLSDCNAEHFYRRTTVDRDGGSVNGMVVSRAVLQNVFQPEVFSLVGVARLNAIINLSLLQELWTQPSDEIKQ